MAKNITSNFTFLEEHDPIFFQLAVNAEKAFSKCPIGIPPINEQTEIVSLVEELFAIADRI